MSSFTIRRCVPLGMSTITVKQLLAMTVDLGRDQHRRPHQHHHPSRVTIATTQTRSTPRTAPIPTTPRAGSWSLNTSVAVTQYSAPHHILCRPSARRVLILCPLAHLCVAGFAAAIRLPSPSAAWQVGSGIHLPAAFAAPLSPQHNSSVKTRRCTGILPSTTVRRIPGTVTRNLAPVGRVVCGVGKFAPVRRMNLLSLSMSSETVSI